MQMQCFGYHKLHGVTAILLELSSLPSFNTPVYNSQHRLRQQWLNGGNDVIRPRHAIP